jgi:nucleotide-binding universal stress UspA family protein
VYRHILVPTDGSRLAARGVREAIRLAKAVGARITVVYVASPFIGAVFKEAAMYYAGKFSSGEYKAIVLRETRKILSSAERIARAAGVPCRTQLVVEARPWQGIVRAARTGRCDAIVMSSHGRGAVGGLILGSEASRVLAHSRIPVLIVR